MKFVGVLLVVLATSSVSFGKTVDEATKIFIYEITSPGVGRATGFVLKDSVLGHVLVTCRHSVQDKNGEFVDSVLVRVNTRLPAAKRFPTPVDWCST